MEKIVIVGGGMTGCSIAYYLAKAGIAQDVVVIEADPTYEFAATPRSVGGIRSVFGVKENVEMSLYGFDVFENFDKFFGADVGECHAGFTKQGYMYVVSGETSVASLETVHEMQCSAGADIQILDPLEMKARWPSLNFDDVDAALFSERDGAVDPHACLHGFRKAALTAGVEFKTDRVVGFNHTGSCVQSAILASGEVIKSSYVINATNYWAPEVCAMVGMDVPIKPLRRQTFFFDCRQKIEPIPVIRDPNGFVIRPEGHGFLTGRTDMEQIGAISHDLDYSVFDEELWPRLAERCKAFEAIKVQSGWAGIYDMNTFDGNPIIGPWSGTMENFIVVAGFSGHGLQQGPAIGRGVTELLLKGRFQTIDLGIFSYQRILDDNPIVDLGPSA